MPHTQHTAHTHTQHTHTQVASHTAECHTAQAHTQRGGIGIRALLVLRSALVAGSRGPVLSSFWLHWLLVWVSLVILFSSKKERRHFFTAGGESTASTTAAALILFFSPRQIPQLLERGLSHQPGFPIS